MSKLSRNKGHSFEREIASLLRPIFPEVRRHLEYQASEARGVDLDATGPFRIQCKRGKRYASISAIEEVQVCPIEGGIPLLVTKGDRTDITVTLYFDDFINLLKNNSNFKVG